MADANQNRRSDRTPQNRRALRRPVPGGIDQLKSRESRTRWDELQYFMVNAACVRCRKVVQAPVDRLQYKLRCPHCGTLMHLREDGKWHEGVHPSMVGQGTDRGGGLRARWKRLSTIPILRHWTVRMTIGVGVIALLVWLAAFGMQPGHNSLPTALHSRAIMAGQAVFAGDQDRFDQLVARETADDAEQWYDGVRSYLNLNPGRYQSVAVEVNFENRTEGVATTILRLQSSSRDDQSYLMYWRPDGDGSWKIDGTRTQREM